MNRKFVALALLALASFGTHAGVKVTSLDLNTNGANGYVSINLEGRSQELPDIKVYGKTIEIVLSNADAFSAITKNVKGAQLSANVLNGKAIVKAILPYDIAASGVDLGWKNSNIEVVFPRGKVTSEVVANPVAVPVKASTPVAAPVVENKVLAKVEKKQVQKDALNEDYLNNLVKEETARRDTDTPRPETTNDELKVKQSAIAKTEASTTVEASDPSQVVIGKKENFSFAGYAVKFTVFLALVLGLFYGVVQLLKKGVFNRGKLGFLNNSQLIQVMSTTFVAPKRSLMVIKAHKQIFLVANSENGIQFLAEMTDTTGLIKEGEKQVTGSNFDLNLGAAENLAFNEDFGLKLKENINESTPVTEKKSLSDLTAKDIVKFSDELKKKAKKLKPIEFN